jgi:hypothetical protein
VLTVPELAETTVVVDDRLAIRKLIPFGWSSGAVLSWALLSGGCGNPPTMPTPPPSNPGLACGVERWFVKTLADSDATKVHPDQVTPISIRDLNGFATHCDALPESRAVPEEFRVFETTGRITFAVLEADRDYHLALEDPAAPQFTIVIELADTDCQGAVLSPAESRAGDRRRASSMQFAGRLLGSRYQFGLRPR